jgi:hypothetical protein
MQDKDLDKIIADKLGELDVPYPANSWNALADKLDADHAVDQFDDQVRQRLTDVEVPYQSSYWDRFAQQLEQDNRLRKRFLRYKLTEALLVLLILVTFVHIFSNPVGVQKLLPVGSLMKTTVESESISTLHFSNSNPSTTNNYLVSNAIISVQNTAVDDATIIDTPNTSLLATTAPIAALPNQALSHVQSIIPIEDKRLGTITSPTIEEARTVLLPTDVAATSIALQAPTPNKQFRIGMYMTSNIDQVKTPYDDIFDLAPITQYVTSYGGGVSLGWKKDRIEIETGFGYSHKQYAPADNSAVRYNNTVEDLRNIELNLVHIPIQVRYNAIQKEKWHVYVLGGTSVHLAVQANYDVSRIDVLSLLISDPNSNINIQQDVKLSPHQETVFDEQGQPSEPASTKLKSKRFPNGLLNGGNYRDNSFYTLTMGAGVERYLDERLSVFLQPTFRQDIPVIGKGLGPNEDRISTVELMVGAKIGF